MSDATVALILLNRAAGAATISTTAGQVGLAPTSTYTVRDLWSKTTTTTSGTITASAPAHGVAMHRVSGAGLLTPTPSATPTASATPTHTPTLPPTSGSAVACSATYRVTSSWPGGFQGEVVVTNTGTTSTAGWSVTWTFLDGQVVSQLWNGNLDQAGPMVTVDNLSYNGALTAGSSTSFGFTASWNAANRSPTNLTCQAR